MLGLYSGPCTIIVRSKPAKPGMQCCGLCKGATSPVELHVNLFWQPTTNSRPPWPTSARWLHISQVWLRCFASSGTVLQPRPAGNSALSHAR